MLLFSLTVLLLADLSLAAIDREGLCQADGYFRHPEACNRFYRCVALGSRFQVYFFDCPPETVFDEFLSVCNWPWAAPPCEEPEDEEEGDGEGDKGDTVIVVAPQFNYECSGEGFFEHESDCTKFWMCKKKDESLRPALFKCPAGYLFNDSKRRCLPEAEVDCDKQPDLARIQFDPVPIQLKVADLEKFFAQFF